VFLYGGRLQQFRVVLSQTLLNAGASPMLALAMGIPHHKLKKHRTGASSLFMANNHTFDTMHQSYNECSRLHDCCFDAYYLWPMGQKGLKGQNSPLQFYWYSLPYLNTLIFIFAILSIKAHHFLG